MKTFPGNVFCVILMIWPQKFHLSKMELNALYDLDIPSQLKLLPSYELRSKLTYIPSLENFDLYENYVQAIYYDSPEFYELYSFLSGKTFSYMSVKEVCQKILISYRMFSLLQKQILI